MSMTNEQALSTASALLGLAPAGGQEKVASAEGAIPTADETYEALGREYAGLIIKQAAEDVVDEKIEQGLFKVAQAAVIDAIENGTIDGYIKMAAGDDEAFAGALKATIFEDQG